MGVHSRRRSHSCQPRHSSKPQGPWQLCRKPLASSLHSSAPQWFHSQCRAASTFPRYSSGFQGDLDIALGNEHNLRQSSKVKGMFCSWNTLFLSLPIFSLQSYTLGVVQMSAAYTLLAITPPCKQDQDVSWRKGFVITLVFQIHFFSSQPLSVAGMHNSLLKELETLQKQTNRQGNKREEKVFWRGKRHFGQQKFFTKGI